MKVVIEIEFGNDAMQRYSQARSVIRDGLGMSEHRAKPHVGDGGVFFDVNGNRVGKWEVVEAPHVSPARVPHAYEPNDLGTDGCSVCGKALAYKIHLGGV